MLERSVTEAVMVGLTFFFENERMFDIYYVVH